MPLSVLSSIKDAKQSESVTKLFETIKQANINKNTENQENINLLNTSIVEVSSLREDTVIESSETEKQFIKANFPLQKNGFLVVPKVID